MSYDHLTEFNTREELDKHQKKWKNDDMVYVKEDDQLLLYCDGYWLEYIEGD